MNSPIVIAAVATVAVYAIFVIADRRRPTFTGGCAGPLHPRLPGPAQAAHWRRSRSAIGELILALLAGYLLMPIDLVPDLIPIAGQLDDLLIAAIALRISLRSSGRDLVAELWPGPPEPLQLVLRGGRRGADFERDARVGRLAPFAGTLDVPRTR